MCCYFIVLLYHILNNFQQEENHKDNTTKINHTASPDKAVTDLRSSSINPNVFFRRNSPSAENKVDTDISWQPARNRSNSRDIQQVSEIAKMITDRIHRRSILDNVDIYGNPNDTHTPTSIPPINNPLRKEGIREFFSIENEGSSIYYDYV